MDNTEDTIINANQQPLAGEELLNSLPTVQTQRGLPDGTPPASSAETIPPIPGTASRTPLAPIPGMDAGPLSNIIPKAPQQQDAAPTAVAPEDEMAVPGQITEMPSDSERIFTPLQPGEKGPTDGADSWRHNLIKMANGWVSVEEAQKELKSSSPPVLPSSPATDLSVFILRQNRNDPLAIEAFEQLHGKGTAQQFLRFATPDNISMVAGPHPDPAAIDAFNQLYGPNMAYWYNMFASNDLNDRTKAANAIHDILTTGGNATTQFETSYLGDVTRGTQRGLGEAVTNTVNTFSWLSNGFLGTKFEDIKLGQEELAKSPLLYNASKIVSQVGAAFAGGYGALGLTGGAAKGSAFIRSMQAGALADMLAFDPNDPLLIELFSRGKEATDKYLSTDPGARRLARAVEGIGAGFAIEGMLKMAGAAVRFARNPTNATKEELAKAVEEVEKKAPPTEYIQQEVEKWRKQSAPVQQQQKAAPVPQPAMPVNPRQTVNEAVTDAIVGKPVRDVEKIIGLPQPSVKPPIDPAGPAAKFKDFAARIGDDAGWEVGSALRLEDVSRSVEPFVDEFRNLRMTRDELRSIFNSGDLAPTEILKTQALVNQTAKQVGQEIIETNAALKVAKESGDMARAAEMEAKLGSLQRELADYQSFDFTRGSFASKAMNIQRATLNAITQPGVRIKIDELAKLGMTPSEIADLMEKAIIRGGKKGSALHRLNLLNTTLNNARNNLEGLVRNKASAEAIEEAQKVLSGAELAVEKQTARVSALGKKAVDGYLKKTLNVLTELNLSALLYSLKTVGVVQYASAAASWGAYTASRVIGKAVRSGPMAAVRDLQARRMAFSSLANSDLGNVISHSFSNASKAFKEEGSYLLKNSEVSGVGSTGRFISDNYLGFGGKALDTAGSAIRLPGKVLSFNDDLLGTAIARSEIASEAASDFLETVAKRKAILKQAGTPEALAERDALTKNPKITISGKDYSHQEYIKYRIEDAFDLKTGRLNADKAKKTVNEILMKNAFESDTMKKVESIATHPVAKLLALPFFRTPIRAIQRGFHYTPLAPLSQQFRNDLLGNSGRAAQEYAIGRFIIGTAWTFWLADKIFNTNEISVTGSGPGNYKLKRSWEQGSWKANHIRIGNEWYDYSNLEPLSTAIKVLANVKQAYDDEYAQRDPKLDQKANETLTQVAMSLAMGALYSGQAFSDSGMLQGLKKIVDMGKIVAEPDRTSGKASEVAGKFAAEKVRSFIPAQLKQIRDYLDPKLKDVMGPLEAISLGFGNRDAVTNQYNVFGEPKYDINPAARLVGVLSSIPKKQLDKLSSEEKTLVMMGATSRLTGKVFEHPTDIPELKGLDLRDVKSPSGRGTMFDDYMKNYSTLKVEGMTIKERLEALTRRAVNFSESDIRTAKLSVPIGTQNFDGPLAEQYSNVLQAHRAAAWRVTKEQYTSGPNKVQQVTDQLTKLKNEKDRSTDLNRQPRDRMPPQPVIGFGR